MRFEKAGAVDEDEKWWKQYGNKNLLAHSSFGHRNFDLSQHYGYS